MRPRGNRTFQLALGILLSVLSAMFTHVAWAAPNPTPYIDETQPVSAGVGEPSFMLTIKGTGFASTASVYWQVGIQRTALTTLRVNETELQAEVPAALTTAPVTAQVVVHNADSAPDDGTSNTVAFPVNAPNPSSTFVHTTFPDPQAQPSFATITGDFNGDGIQDVAVCTFGVVTILLGSGNGTFTPAPSLTVGTDAYSIAKGDFNGDGNLDLVVPADSGITILLGKGNGTFTRAPMITLGSFLYNVVVGDLNGDGIPDLAVSDGGDDKVYTLLGKGDGTFTPTATASVGVFDSITELVSMGDFDNNGTLDLAVLSLAGGQGTNFVGVVNILSGNGNGTFNYEPVFDVQNVYLAQGSITSMAVGDFNGDGNLDLAISGCGSQVSTCSPITTQIFLGNGNETFTLASTVAAGGASMQVGDINGDGKLDLAFTNQAGVGVLLGNGDGTFTPLAAPASNTGALSIALADFNNDGRLDITSAAFSGEITLLQVKPALVASPAELNFGTIPFLGVDIKDVTLTNISNARVDITAVAMATPGNDPAAFNISNSCPASLEPGASCQLNVTALPGVAPGDTETGTLSVTYTGLGSPLQVPASAVVGRLKF
jgi:hypothetical protein